MSKRLLAAALAAAFLATGGVARGADWDITGTKDDLYGVGTVVNTNGGDSTIKGYYDGSSSQQGIGYVDTYVDGSGATQPATVTNNGTVLVTGGTAGQEGMLFIGGKGTIQNSAGKTIKFDEGGSADEEGSGYLGIESGGKLVNSGNLIFGINSGIVLTKSGLADPSNIGTGSLLDKTGAIVNSGTIQLDAKLNTAAGADKTALTTATAGSGLENAFRALINGQKANGTNGANGIGNVVLTGTVQAAIDLHDITVFGSDAYAGTVTLRDTEDSEYTNGNGKFGETGTFIQASKAIDVAGAKLVVGSPINPVAGGSAANYGSAALAGRNVDLNVAGTGTTAAGGNKYAGYGVITAWGDEAGSVATYGAGQYRQDHTNPNGTVTVNAKGTNFGAAIYAGDLVINQNAKLDVDAEYQGNITVVANTKLTNSAAAGNVDLSGKKLTGNGMISNTYDSDPTGAVVGAGGNLTINGFDAAGNATVIDPNFVIYNASTMTATGAQVDGTIITNGAGLDAFSSNLKVARGKTNDDIAGSVYGGGYGTISVLDGDLDLKEINWSDAESGDFNWNASTTDNKSSFTGKINLGAGNFSTVGTDSIIMNTGSSIASKLNTIGNTNAAATEPDFFIEEGATLDGGLDLDNNVRLENEGIISVGLGTRNPKDLSTDHIDLDAGSELINRNVIDLGKMTEFDTTNDVIDNSEGQIKANADMKLGEIANLADSIDDSVDSVGIIDITGTMKDDFVLAANAGTVTLKGNQTQDVDLKVGKADVNVILEGTKATKLDEVEGANVYITGEGAAKSVIKSAKSTGGDVTLDSSGIEYQAAATVDGDLNITGNRNTFTTNPVTADEDALGDKGNIFVDGDSNLFKVTVTADNDVNANGQQNVFEQLVTATAGDVNVRGTATFENGINTDNTEGYAARVFEHGTATIGGPVVGDIDAMDKSIVEIGGGKLPDLTMMNGEFKTGDQTTVEFMRKTNGEASQIYLEDHGGITGVAGTLNWDSGMHMFMDGDLPLTKNDVHELIQGVEFDANGVATNFAIDNNLATREQIVEFLNSESLDAFGWSGDYEIDPDTNVISYRHTIDKSYDQYLDAMARQNMQGNEGIYSENTYLALRDEFGNISQTEMTALEGLEDSRIADLAKVMTGAAGQNRYYDLAGNRRAAYAAAQFLNGQDLAGSLEAVQDTVRNFNKAMTNRANNLGAFFNTTQYDECGQPIEDCGGYKNRVWAGYSGQWGKNNGRDWNSGYKYDAHGFNVGYDHMTSSGFGFGAAFGYSRGEFDNYGALNDDSKIHNYDFGLFASYNHCSGVFAQVLASYTYSNFKMNNQFADTRLGHNDYGFSAGFSGWDYAKYHAKTWSIGGKLGYDIKPVAGLTITPTIGIYNYRTHTNTFNTSAGRLGMKYKRNITEMPVEVTAKYDISLGCDTTLSLMANAGYTYNFSNKGVSQQGFASIVNPDTVLGGDRYMKPGHSAWNVGGGAQFRYRNVDVGVNYEYYGRRSYKSHSVNANVGVSF